MVPRGTRTLCGDTRTAPRAGHPAVPETFAGVANVRGVFPAVLDDHFRGFRHWSSKTFCRSRRDLAICVAGTRALRGDTNWAPRETPGPSTTLIRVGNWPSRFGGKVLVQGALFRGFRHGFSGIFWRSRRYLAIQTPRSSDHPSRAQPSRS